MKIAIIGTGYVGLVSGACLADFGHEVFGADCDDRRIRRLRAGELPFHEPGLSEMVDRHAATGRLRFTADIEEAVAGARVVFLAVGTPEGANGEADLSQVTEAAAGLATYLAGHCVIANKSTVPVGTGALISEVLARRVRRGVELDVVSNPEFLREGSAISDFLRPDRIVIGTSSERAASVMRELYRPLYLIETPMIFTTVETAEMIKYASNGFLAVKISFINEIANLCDRTGADVHMVAKAMGLDKRIGSKFLHPGPGYGGSCFPKDTRALAALGVRHDTRQEIVEAAIRVNERQRKLAIDKIVRALDGVAGRRIAVLGLAFKPNTSDVRESPGLYICRTLHGAGAVVRAFDPVATCDAARVLPNEGRGILADSPYAAAEDADALVIVTEWNEFRNLDLERLAGVLRQPVIFDLRNVLEPARARRLGFKYYSMGRDALGLTPAERHVEVAR